MISLFMPSAILPGCYTANAAQKIYCSQCGHRITGKYLKSGNRYYCSKRCLEKSLPKCSVCGKPATIKRSDGKYFCSQRCLAKTWPVCSACGRHSKEGIKRGVDHIFLCSRCAAKPKCFSCFMPADYGKLSDGRYICKHCHKTAVIQQSKAEKIANEVRNIMRDKLAIFTDHNISYHLVSQTDLKKHLTHDDKGIELGLYRFEQTIEKSTITKKSLGRVINTTTEEKIKDETHQIYFLFGIPENKFREVAAHELAHDWMQEYYPNVTDIKIKEGWAEFVASLVNKISGNSAMNRRMELNKNKIYGDGYRMIKKYVQNYKIEGLLDMFKEQ
jgi:endogenous inhibitor of DNA gyrase (YacG/DUF329 family)